MEEKRLTREQQALLDALDDYLHQPVKEAVHHVFGDFGDPLTEKFIAEEEKNQDERNRFRDCVIKLMDKKGIKKFSDVYKAACISKYTFSRIMNYDKDRKPAKETVAALAIGLKCTMDEAQELYHAAGFHLGTTDFLDRVIGFFIREKRYSVNEVNFCLDYFGASLIGEQSRDRG